MLMGRMHVIVHIVRELPQRIGHIAVRVLVHIGPAHTDHIEHRVLTPRLERADEASLRRCPHAMPPFGENCTMVLL
ncbi:MULTISPECIES: hypothetical protein [unclassified Streptomyces]|uniref:hypothetical protein n=1 Tax=unclassified Streptomyces TaxID=2593676 RepID=UPI002E1464F8|nr:hypothetical protein OG466_40540 [Streptomyces sp. NBC_01240]